MNIKTEYYKVRLVHPNSQQLFLLEWRLVTPDVLTLTFVSFCRAGNQTMSRQCAAADDALLQSLCEEKFLEEDNSERKSLSEEPKKNNINVVENNCDPALDLKNNCEENKKKNINTRKDINVRQKGDKKNRINEEPAVVGFTHHHTNDTTQQHSSSMNNNHSKNATRTATSNTAVQEDNIVCTEVENENYIKRRRGGNKTSHTGPGARGAPEEEGEEHQNINATELNQKAADAGDAAKESCGEQKKSGSGGLEKLKSREFLEDVQRRRKLKKSQELGGIGGMSGASLGGLGIIPYHNT